MLGDSRYGPSPRRRGSGNWLTHILIAKTQAMAAGALAIERGVATEQIAAAGGLALHAAAFNGMPDPVLHLAARAMGVVTGLAALEPDPRAPGADVLLDATLQAATGLQQLLAFRRMTAPPSPPRRSRPPPPPDSPAPLPDSARPPRPCTGSSSWERQGIPGAPARAGHWPGRAEAGHG